MHAHDATPLTWFFACPQFIEPLLANELTSLGAQQVKIGHAGVQAHGDLTFAYTALLWSRLASRATLQLASGFGKNQQELLVLLQSIPWDEHLRANGSLKVRFFGLNDDIRNTQFGAQWVKDQIADYFVAREGIRPNVSNEPDLVVVVNLHKGNASVGIELNQHSLHHRGYRQADSRAAMRENLAAAVLVRAGWPELIASDATTLALFDPICGAGTLLIEGALMALDIAPGLLRTNTVAERWLGHDANLWQQLWNNAEQRRTEGLAKEARYVFWGNDSNPAELIAARADWRSIDLPAARWTQGALTAMPEASAAASGLVINHTPYQTSMTAAALQPLYQALGQWMARLPTTYQGALFADANAPIPLTNLFYSKEYRFVNSEDECKLYTFNQLAQKERPTDWFSEDLANRILKNLRKLKPLIKRGDSDAYRVYDADIPEYAIAVDRYADWLHIQEYAPPKTIDEKTAKHRLEQALMTLPNVLDVNPNHIVLKQRKQQKGKSQYEKQGRAEQALHVTEHGVTFKVNLTDYLDTGLFLDHRPMRYWLQQHAKDKRVLNLFCYTGTASVHAAVGGASRVDSVDMSATYLAWARENLALNGFQHDPYRRYRFIQDNVLDWLSECNEQYDLIFLDPPTFSNSKRMEGAFDVQRDHIALINDAMRILSAEGTLIFSNNFRKFQLDPEVEAKYQVQDYRKASLPLDFERDPKIHGCWLIKHR